MVLKRGTTVNWLIDTIFGLLGGVYFPITVLPAWLQKISAFLPVTYAIRSLEMAVYQGTSLQDLSAPVTKLLVFAACLLPLGILSFRWALQKARKEGSLGWY